MVGVSLMGPDRKHRIQKHHSLIRPFFQIAVIGNIAAQIVVKLLVNIYKGRRHIYIRFYGEAKAMGLTVIVIGILSQDHYLYLFQRCKGEGVEDIVRIGKYLSGLIFMFYCFIQLFIIRLFKFPA